VYEHRPPSVPFKKKIINKTETKHQPALYRSLTLREAYALYKKMKQEEAEEEAGEDYDFDGEVAVKVISQKTFEKVIDERFKKGKQSSDVCNYCHYSTVLLRDVHKFVESYFIMSKEDREFYLTPQNDLLGYRNFLVDKEVIGKEKFKIGFDKNSDDFNHYMIDLETYKKKNAKLEDIQFHKNCAAKQRSAYNEYRKNPRLLHRKLLIEMDYKQKISLGQGKVQIGSEYFLKKGEKKKQVSLLGFGLFYLQDKRDGSYAPDEISEEEWQNYFVNYLNIDVISNDHRSDCFIVKEMFKHVMEIPFFKLVDQPNWIIFTDCGEF
jgi:hypothetical protein